MPAVLDASTIAVASRPRTLVLVVSPAEIEAVMLGPTGAELGTHTRVPRTSDPSACLQAMWSELEPMGEFDRITVTTKAGLGDEWEPAALRRELERQSSRPVRVLPAELRWSHVIRKSGVELVLALGAELDSALFLDGTHVPGLALGRHRFRKGRTYQEYLAPRVLENKGVRTWNRRLARVVAEVRAVWNPSTLYVAAPTDLLVVLEHDPTVVIVPNPTDLEGALALWR